MTAQAPFLLIVEGPDGVGKSTFCRQLLRLLLEHGRDAILVREPMDRACITADDPIKAFAEDRARLYRDFVLPALSADKLVISDRSVYSSLAYQGQGDSVKTQAVLQANMASGALPALSQLFKYDQMAVIVLLPSQSFRPESEAVDDNDRNKDIDVTVRSVYASLVSETGQLYVEPDTLEVKRIKIKDAVVLGDDHAADRWALGLAVVAKAILAPRPAGR